MEHQQSKVDDIYEKFTWKFENFSCLKITKKFYSEPFILCGYPWRILMFPQGNDVEYLSIYLEATKSANMSKGWCRDVEFSLAVFNRFDSRTITRDTWHKFDEQEADWGFTSFMPLAELNDPQKGFLVKDTCIIVVEVSVLKAINEKQVSQVASLTTKHTEEELFGALIDELMDFRDLGRVEKAFVPLLEEVCSHHPSLIESQQKRSRKFTGWAFSALGRVLYFLKTKKVKDMNDLACENLQSLWDELETFGFDLTWLEPHVKSTLGMKSYVEKALQVEKLKANFVAAEVNLDAERDLLKAKGFQVKDLDAELGYGSFDVKDI